MFLQGLTDFIQHEVDERAAIGLRVAHRYRVIICLLVMIDNILYR